MLGFTVNEVLMAE